MKKTQLTLKLAKEIHSKIVKSNVDKKLLAQLNEIKEGTENFSDEDLFDVYKENLLSILNMIWKFSPDAYPLTYWNLFEDKKKPAPKPTSKPTSKPKTKSKPKPKTTPKPEPKPEPKSKPKSKPKTKSVQETEIVFVDQFDVAVKLIRSFVALRDKAIVKSRILALYKRFEKEIQKRTIRKNSEMGCLISDIRDFLKDTYDNFEAKSKEGKITIKVTEKKMQLAKAITDKRKVLPAIRLLNSFVGLVGKKDVEEKIKRWRKSALKAVENVKGKRLTKTHKASYDALKQAIEMTNCVLVGEIKELKLPASSLSGINGDLYDCGCSMTSKNKSTRRKSTTKNTRVSKSACLGNLPQNGVISSINISSGDTNFVPLTKYWMTVFGKPTLGFSAMLSSAAGSGKSTLALNFANYYANKIGKALYVSYEQIKGNEITGALAQLIKRRKAQHENLHFAGSIPSNLSNYGLVVVDSVTTANLSPTQVLEMIRKFPDTNFVLIYQQTKEGLFRGSSEHLFNLDMEVKVINGEAFQGSKNRFAYHTGNDKVKIQF